MKFFIKRPTAVVQFRREAGYPDDADPVELERELRAALTESTREFYGRLEGRQIFRIQIPGKKTVYAVGNPAKHARDYDMVISSIKSEEAYRQNTRMELKRTRKATTAFLRYPNGDEELTLVECSVEEIPTKIMELLRGGLRDDQIEVLKSVPWALDITLQEFAS